eukprot:scaffold35708_cov129-Isochrysis_galbana.AAC.3
MRNLATLSCAHQPIPVLGQLERGLEPEQPSRFVICVDAWIARLRHLSYRGHEKLPPTHPPKAGAGSSSQMKTTTIGRCSPAWEVSAPQIRTHIAKGTRGAVQSPESRGWTQVTSGAGERHGALSGRKASNTLPLARTSASSSLGPSACRHEPFLFRTWSPSSPWESSSPVRAQNSERWGEPSPTLTTNRPPSQNVGWLIAFCRGNLVWPTSVASTLLGLRTSCSNIVASHDEESRTCSAAPHHASVLIAEPCERRIAAASACAGARVSESTMSPVVAPEAKVCAPLPHRTERTAPP